MVSSSCPTSDTMTTKTLIIIIKSKSLTYESEGIKLAFLVMATRLPSMTVFLSPPSSKNIP
jgi:hypothetical protein